MITAKKRKPKPHRCNWCHRQTVKHPYTVMADSDGVQRWACMNCIAKYADPESWKGRVDCKCH